MSELIEIIPETELRFDGREGSAETIVLRDEIPMLPYASGTLEVLVAAIVDMEDTASCAIEVYNQSVSPEDPELLFAGTTPIASVSLNFETPTPSLLTDALTGAIAPLVRVVLVWSQGAAAASAVQRVTLSARLAPRPGEP